MSSLKPIKCKAAVMYDYQKPLVVEEVIIDPPEDDQVRVKMISAGICLSEATLWQGKFKLSDGGQQMPIVLGHEGAGIVESVGPKVTNLKVGDHVLTTYVTRCEQCHFCASPLTNLCAKDNVFLIGLTPNKTLAKTGAKMQSFTGLGSWSEYILVRSNQVDKIDSSVRLQPLSSICCATGAGFGAARDLARVVPGSSVATFGGGAFALNVLFGARLNGATRLIVVDSNNDRKQLATEFGATEFVNPTELDRPVSQYLCEKYAGGVDYVFDCNGDPETMTEGFRSLTPYGKFVFVALTHSGATANAPCGELAFGKSIIGGFFGNRKSADMYREVLDLYKSGQFPLDKMITHKFKLEQVNEALATVVGRVAAKTIIVFDE